MIYTLTLNPSIDYVMRLDSLELGSLNRTNEVKKVPGGKGLTVSRVLHRFGVPNRVLGFSGGHTGKLVEEYLQDEGLDVQFINIQEDTRINVKLKTKKETEINAGGPAISEQELASLLDQLGQLQSGDTLVMGGTIPSSIPADLYEALTHKFSPKGIRIVVDTSGESLKEVISDRPFFIKPNHHELGELFQTVIDVPEQVIPYGQKLVEMGVENIIVSMAAKGALFFNREKSLYAKAPQGTVKDSVGAGDSLVAGFLAGLEQTGDAEQAFRLGVASGSATAFSYGLCTKEEADSLLPSVEIIDLNKMS